MSPYYKYNFISAEPIFALVKEELKTYFDTGVVDDLLFGIWTDTCLQKLSKGVNPIYETVIVIDDFQGKLPQNFYSAREAWLLSEGRSRAVQNPSAVYWEETITKLCSSEKDVRCAPCDGIADEVRITFKSQDTLHFTTAKKSYLLLPGRVSNFDTDFQVTRPSSPATERFDVQGNKLVVNFRKALVHLTYYGKSDCEPEGQLVPDDFRIKQAVEAYLKQKCFEIISNSITDESSNQVERKLQSYKQEANEALVIAQAETKKHTLERKITAIRKSYNRHNHFNIR